MVSLNELNYIFEKILQRINTQGHIIYKSDKPGYSVQVVDGSPVEVKKRKVSKVSPTIKKRDKQRSQFLYKTPGTTKGGAFKAKVTREGRRNLGLYDRIKKDAFDKVIESPSKSQDFKQQELKRRWIIRKAQKNLKKAEKDL